MRRFLKLFFSILVVVVLYSVLGIILANQEKTREAVQGIKVAAEKKLGIDQPCGRPLTFSIGTIDSKFGVSKEQLAKLAQSAAAVWNKAAGKTLLQFDPNSSFKINLVYDSRQAQSNAAQDLQNDLNDLEATNKSLIDKYNSLSASYQKKAAQYEKDLASYKNKLNEYNSEVKYWNKKGNIPQDEYDKLNKEKKELEDDYDSLKKEQKEVNALAGQSQKIAGQENKIVNQYNAGVNTYTQKYGNAREFEKGVFDGKEIDIYQFQAAPDLELTLAHELGHYLGLQHVGNPQSIMYYLLGAQDMDNIVPTAEDLSELNKICKL